VVIFGYGGVADLHRSASYPKRRRTVL
jgi:hypothetical protein